MVFILVKEMYKAVWVWIGDEVSEEVLEKKFPYKLFAYDPKNWAYNFGQRDLLIDHGLMVITTLLMIIVACIHFN